MLYFASKARTRCPHTGMNGQTGHTPTRAILQPGSFRPRAEESGYSNGMIAPARHFE